MGLDSKQALVGVTLGCYKEEVLGQALQPTTARGCRQGQDQCFLFPFPWPLHQENSWLKGWVLVLESSSLETGGGKLKSATSVLAISLLNVRGRKPSSQL